MQLPPKHDVFFVGVQFALFTALAFSPGWATIALPSAVQWLGWSICALTVLTGLLAVAQLGSNLTPWPSPKQAGHLVTTGLYARSRHPIYSVLMGFGVGLSLSSGSLSRLAITCCLYLLFRAKARYEERLLQNQYPSYDAYAKRTPRFRLGLGFQ